MKTVAIKTYGGVIRMGNAIRSTDKGISYTVEDKPVKQIWKQKIDELNEIIYNTEMNKDGRIIQLYRKLALLERAFNRCGS